MSRVRIVFLGEDPRDPLQIAAADYLARAGKRFDAALVPLKPTKRGKGADDDRVRSTDVDRLQRVERDPNQVVA